MRFITVSQFFFVNFPIPIIVLVRDENLFFFTFTFFEMKKKTKILIFSPSAWNARVYCYIRKRPRMTHCVYQLILVLRRTFLVVKWKQTQTHTHECVTSYKHKMSQNDRAEKKLFQCFWRQRKKNLDVQDEFIPLHCDLIELCI